MALAAGGECRRNAESGSPPAAKRGEPYASRALPAQSLALRAMPLLHVPEPLRAYCGGAECVALDGETIAELLAALAEQFPELGARVLDASGGLAPHLVLIRNDAVLRPAELAGVRISAADELRLFTAVSGG